MKFVFIGTGSAFTVGENYQSNMYFETDSKERLLIDCGCDARRALYELDLTCKDIDAVYISHLHSDHIGGLEWLALSRNFDQGHLATPKLYLHESMTPPLWDSLCPGLSTAKDSKVALSTYFDLHQIGNSHAFNWKGTQFQIFPTEHQFCNHQKMPSFGLETTINETKILLTTDSIFPTSEKHALMKKYASADIIFQDCETKEKKSGVHAHYTELKSLPTDIRKKMWLYHYQPGDLPNAVKDGFRGFAKKGQTFLF